MYSLCGSLLSFPVKAMFFPTQTVYCRVMTVTNNTSHIKIGSDGFSRSVLKNIKQNISDIGKISPNIN